VGNVDVGWDDLRATLWVRDGAIELGTLGEGLRSWATDINDRGQVVGYAEADVIRAVIWENAVPLILPSLGTSASYAKAINNRGDIVGYVNTEQGQRPVFVRH
jgi:probable HAF family extracellular repeat protein